MPGKTFQDHLLDLAETFGTVQATDAGRELPDNGYELDKLKRKFNEGLSILALENPIGWYCLRRVVAITIDQDGAGGRAIDAEPSEYRVPDEVAGEPEGDWEWESPGDDRSGPAMNAPWSEVVRLLASDTTTGEPQLVAMTVETRARSEAGTAPTWRRVRVFPRPDQEYTLRAMFVLTVRPLTELSEMHPFGARFDQVAQAAARWAWVMNDASDARYDTFKSQYETLRDRAITLDVKDAPKRLGRPAGADPHAYAYGRSQFTYNGANPNG